MSDLDAFRSEARAWLEANAPASLRGLRKGRFDGWWGGRRDQNPPDDVRRWHALMLERGWTVPTWPTEYGGAALSRDEARALDDELRRLLLPPPVVGFGITMIGPTLLDHGDEAQKREHLPRIARGEIRWCQGYSEPGAGSDLASLRTRAVLDGEAFVVNGQKVWTSFADRSDWIFCLVRTDPGAVKQKGITFLLIDMATPGVSTRGIQLISGASPFCEVFLQDVRVPLANVVGRVDAGWTVGKALLGYERTMIGEATAGQLSDVERDLVALARRHLGASTGPLPDAALRAQIARAAMDERCLSLTLRRIEEGMAAGRPPGSESSIIKICGSELKQRRWELATRIAGPAALGWDGEAYSPDDLSLTRDWLRSRANSVEGGTSEIQLNILAKRVLGLAE